MADGFSHTQKINLKYTFSILEIVVNKNCNQSSMEDKNYFTLYKVDHKGKVKDNGWMFIY